jgi:hypothetical protein
MCANGLLGPNRSVSIGEIRDGTTFTMLVGEQSGYIGTNIDNRSSARWGFSMGVDQLGYPGGPGTWTGANQTHNIVTMRYPIGHKTPSAGMQPLASDATNIDQECTNSSIRSAHRGGAFVLRADGGTKFLSDGTDYTGVLRYLAVYDDKAVIKQNPLE